MSKRHKFYPEDIFVPGLKIRKFSGKPFKYGGKIGTISEVVFNDQSGKPGVRIKEDGTVVDIFRIGPAEDLEI